MISSLANAQVKHIRRLQYDRRFRNRTQEFVIEGTRLLQEVSVFPDSVKAVYFTEGWAAENGHSALLDGLSTHSVSEQVMSAVSATETPAGVVAVAGMRSKSLPANPALVLVLDGLTNPGNMGSILRSAGAAGVNAVLLAPGCVDVYNPKVVRGAMGAHFRLPVRQLNWQEIAAYCAQTTIWETAANGETIYSDVNWRHPSTLIIGNEAHGTSKEAHDVSQGSVKIPMADETESLNAATAATVLLFEIFRQKDFSGITSS